MKVPQRDRSDATGSSVRPIPRNLGWILLGIAAVAAAVAVAMARTALAGTPAQAPAEPSLVTLRLRDVPAKEAYEQVVRSSGVQVNYVSGWPPPERRVTLTLVREPFWEAMARIGGTSGMIVQYVRRNPRQEVLLLPESHHRDLQQVARAADGLFFATLVDRVPDAVRLKPTDPTRRWASFVTVSLFAEPKVKPLLLHSVDIEELVDESGRPIVVAQKYPRSTTFSRGEAFLPIRLAERPFPRRIGRMRIVGKVLAATQSEWAEVTDLMSDESPATSAAGFRIETRSREVKDGRMIAMTLTRAGNNAPEWLRPASRLQLLEPIVFDREGRRANWYVRDRDWFGRSCRVQVIVRPPASKKLTSNDPGPPHRLLMEIPTDVTEYDVRLEFHDVSVF